MGRKNNSKRLNRLWLRYEYKHTTIAVAALLLFVLLFDSALMNTIFHSLNQFGYIGGLVAGVLAASLITAAPALVLIVELAQHVDPLALALIVGLGNALGDMILLLFFDERIFHELAPLGRRLGIARRISRTRKSKRMSTPLLLTGAFVIMTPLPDEIGLGLLGISHFPRIFIFIICIALNTLGAALVIFTARVLY